MRVINRDVCAFREEVADESDCGRFTGVTRVSLECKTKNSNVLSKYKRPLKKMELRQNRVNGNTLLVIVLKSESTTRFEKRCFWYSFRVTT